MNLFSRLRREETGNVLYMTLVAILVLVVFSLVFINVIYICVLKVRAQNAADNLALSAATLKARVLNKVADLNAGLYFVVRKFGQVPVVPYDSETEYLAMGALDNSIVSTLQGVVAKYKLVFYPDLNRIAHENGIRDSTHKVDLFPLDIFVTDFSTAMIPVSYQGSGGIVSGGSLVGSIEPKKSPWWVQTRVEWPTRGEMIGLKNLKVRLPNIAVRARAMVYDTASGTLPYQHCWKVRLVQPDEVLDEKMKNHDYIW